MTRSSSKGPYVDPRVLKKIAGKKPQDTGVIKTWYRRSQISPEMVGFMTQYDEVLCMIAHLEGGGEIPKTGTVLTEAETLVNKCPKCGLHFPHTTLQCAEAPKPVVPEKGESTHKLKDGRTYR